MQRTWAEEQQMVEDGQRHTINGLSYGNLHGLDLNEGERVRWYLFGLGGEEDIHSPHWHGMTVVEDGQRRTDVIELMPGSMKVADMVADNPGTWLFHCHVADHMANGMFARVTVHPAASPITRAPEVAFLGMPQSLATLQIQTADLHLDQKAGGELDFSGQVTVPDPFPVARHVFTASIGGQNVTFKPDASGICVLPQEGILLVKNLDPHGNGVVQGGTLKFDLVLKGSRWIAELTRLRLLHGGQLATHASLPLSLVVGDAHHSAVVPVKLASQ